MPTLSPLLESLDCFNRLAPGSHLEDSQDLSWPGVGGTRCSPDPGESDGAHGASPTSASAASLNTVPQYPPNDVERVSPHCPPRCRRRNGGVCTCGRRPFCYESLSGLTACGSLVGEFQGSVKLKAVNSVPPVFFFYTFSDVGKFFLCSASWALKICTASFARTIEFLKTLLCVDKANSSLSYPEVGIKYDDLSRGAQTVLLL